MTSSNDSLVPSKSKGLSAPVAEPVAEKQPYRAFEVSSTEQRYLEIRVKFPDPAECPSYAMLSHIRAAWRGGQAITLEFGKVANTMMMMVSICGENLTGLYRALKEWKVEWLAEFDPQENDQPTDDDAPFIRSITIHTTRPEEPPPADKRH